jgi:RNA polymerase sigma-70 factor, Bacteroides expansion family 1
MMKSDNDLLKLLQEGDESSIKLVFEKYYEGLCLFAESIIRDHQAAEEIVEDIFIHLWLNIDSIAISSSVKGYLYRSVHNNCLKYLSKVKSQKKVFNDLHYSVKDEELLHPLTPSYPISNLIIQELEEKANQVLESLPSQCREIYMLNRFENLSYSEIAQKLDIHVGTVKTQMSRAFQKLREALKEYIPLIITFFLLR